MVCSEKCEAASEGATSIALQVLPQIPETYPNLDLQAERSSFLHTYQLMASHSPCHMEVRKSGVCSHQVAE